MGNIINTKLSFCIDGYEELQQENIDDGCEGVKQLPPDTNRDISNTELPAENTVNHISEAMKQLDDDTLDGTTGMSNIDMRTVISEGELKGLLSCDALVMLNVDTIDTSSFSRQFKRLAVSKKGRGRDDRVKILAGEREHEANKSMSLFDKFKSSMSLGNNNG